MVQLERSNIALSDYTLFKLKKIFFIYKNQFLCEKGKIVFYFCSLFWILPKFSNCRNPDDCIGKLASKSIGLQPVFILKKIWS